MSFVLREVSAWSFWRKARDEVKGGDISRTVASSDNRNAFDRFSDDDEKTTTTEGRGEEEEEEENGRDDARATKRERREKNKKLERERQRREEEEEKKREEQKAREGESPAGSLHEAIDDDDFDELEDLLKWKPNLKEPCKKIGQTKDFTPIMKAAHLGRAKMIDLLLDYGANPNVRSDRYSVLMRSVMSKDLESVKVLWKLERSTFAQKTAMMDLGLCDG